jgi:4-hydroxythreonine-4-phosphate dehydrogenase
MLLMLMVKDDLRVRLFTDHIPLEGSSSFNRGFDFARHETLLEKPLIKILVSIQTKIAVLGLNHIGAVMEGLLVQRKMYSLKPTIKKIFEKGTLVLDLSRRWVLWW